MNKREVGSRYEAQAADFLERQGYEILQRNYRNQAGEIDLVARDGDYLVFVEVKYRRDKSRGGALEAVDMRKQRRICRAALLYRAQKRISGETPCRFDAVGVDGETLSLVKNAFDFCGGAAW